jgi:hypothetical protein
MLAIGDHLLSLHLFSTLSPDEKSEFDFRHNSFRFISKRSGRRESLISPDLVRIQRFVDYRESNQANQGVLVWCYCWKSYVWQGKRVSCRTRFSSSHPINNSVESERLITIPSESDDQRKKLETDTGHNIMMSRIRLLKDEFVIAMCDFLVYAYYLRGTSLVRNHFE